MAKIDTKLALVFSLLAFVCFGVAYLTYLQPSSIGGDIQIGVMAFFGVIFAILATLVVYWMIKD